MDFALRTIESIAFTLHAILGITEPCTGCLRNAFKDNGAMPTWFWPIGGMILGLIAFLNFSDDDNIILAVQAYIATFHIGAILYHRVLGHDPAVGIAPGVFVVLALVVTGMRAGVWLALLGIVPCVIVARFLCWVLVTPPEKEGETSLLVE